jgi:hypothetical protein
MSSQVGCETSACVDLANYVVIDHGDGTASITCTSTVIRSSRR